MVSRRRVVVVCVLLALLLASEWVDAKKRKDKSAKGKKKRGAAKKKKEKVQEAPASKPTETHVKQRGLVSTRVTAKSVLKESHRYCKNTTHVHFSGPVLGYVTPWNNKGYDVAKTFANKFSIISPVWFNLRPGMDLVGGHDVDKGWLSDVAARSTHTDIAFMPRVLFDQWPLDALRAVLQDHAQHAEIAALIARTATAYKFDGIVLELWSQVQHLVAQHRAGLHALITAIAHALHAKERAVVLVVPPAGQTFTAADFAVLAPEVDLVSLMTYDYSHAGKPGPNAPLGWMRDSVRALTADAPQHARKVLLGLNFFGNDFAHSKRGGQGGPIIGTQFVETVAAQKPSFVWDGDAHEHYFLYQQAGAQRVVYFPTLKSIAERLALAEELGLGVAVWEIGQGLDYFYDLL